MSCLLTHKEPMWAENIINMAHVSVAQGNIFKDKIHRNTTSTLCVHACACPWVIGAFTYV